MWDRIKRLWHKPKETGLTLPLAEQHRQMEYFWDELHARHLDGLASKVKPFLQSDDPAIVQKALRLLGLEQFHQHEYAKALPYFAKLAEQTQNTTDWFNVVTSATLAGQLDQGEAAFDNAVKNHSRSDDAKQPSIAMLHYFYACALRDMKAYERAFEHVDVLRAIYGKLPNTSPEQLNLRGLAPVSHILDLFVDVLAESGDVPGAMVWLRHFARELDEPGRLAVDEAIVRLHNKVKSSKPSAAAGAVAAAVESDDTADACAQAFTTADAQSPLAFGEADPLDHPNQGAGDTGRQASPASAQSVPPAQAGKSASGDLFAAVDWGNAPPAEASEPPPVAVTHAPDPLDAKP